MVIIPQTIPATIVKYGTLCVKPINIADVPLIPRYIDVNKVMSILSDIVPPNLILHRIDR